MISQERRRMPIGAEVQVSQNTSSVHFRVWAPQREQIKVLIEGGPGEGTWVPLSRDDDGYFQGLAKNAGAGTLYRFELDGSQTAPDPPSRFQPSGPHGPSQVIDPAAFEWTDGNWKGISPHGQILYEMHVGTFTQEGNWKAAEQQLEELASAGISVIEVMPVADFPGRFGWGYDGVALFAPTWLFGHPDEFRSFVNHAHATGMGVILDVVYNHFGPDGNYLKHFSEGYFTKKYENDWGEAINFDGADSAPVREFFVSNAVHWIDEYHLDGLRLDATQQIFDDSPRHILAEIASSARDAAKKRSILLVAENEPQDSRLVREEEKDGYGLDALWNDDFHHTAIVALTGKREAYYTDYKGSPQEFISAAKYGFLYQGQRYKWQKARRGTSSLDLKPWNFVTFLENHDQVANSARGLRVHRLSQPGGYRALTALLLLGPGTPMLFQGQEFASSKPFLYFADHMPELSQKILKGRGEFLAQFPSMNTPDRSPYLCDPGSPSTFERCKLDFNERLQHAETYALHKDLIKIRKTHAAFQLDEPGTRLDGAVLSGSSFVLRYSVTDGTSEEESGGDRLVIVNLGLDLDLSPAPEPLLAPPANTQWKMIWSSDDPVYGGEGAWEPETENGWKLPGHCTLLMKPVRPSANPIDKEKEAK
jgi:maltooligosyltrehalose trehalohydrolase